MYAYVQHELDLLETLPKFKSGSESMKKHGNKNYNTQCNKILQSKTRR
jgi:hypothetical protein